MPPLQPHFFAMDPTKGLWILTQGFRKGRSTEAAISRILTKLETQKQLSKPAIAIFLDIKGAFDNVSLTSLYKALQKRGVNSTTLDWYLKLLNERTTFAENEASGKPQYIRHKRGVPQGGILSPTMWNLAFDDYLSQVSPLADEIAAYADDVCIVLTGETYLEAHIKARKALKLTERWSVRNNISFCPQKTEYLNYTWKPEGPPFVHPLTLYNQNITESTKFKYLGLTFNTSLTWSQHIHHKVKKSKLLLKNASSAFGKIWGPSPRMIKWMLEAVVLPKILYASHVWHADTYKTKIKLLLRQITRLALIQMSPCRLHSPTAGLEIITGTIPIHLRAREKNVLTLLRLLQYSTSNYQSSPHLEHLMQDFSTSGLGNCELDKITPILPAEQKYTTFTPSEHTSHPNWPHDSYSTPQSSTPPSLHIYTDGSKINEQNKWGTGGGLCRVS